METAERCRAQRLLDGLVQQASAGRGQAALVLGPPGVGKSSLASHVRARAERSGAVVVSAVASATERSFAFGIVSQLLAGLGRSPAALATLHEAPATAAGAVYDAVSAAAEQTPLIVIVDDAHHVDGESLRCLLHVIQRVESLRVLLLLTARSDLPEDNLALTAEYVRNPRCSLITLAALCLQCTEKIIAERLGPGPAHRAAPVWQQASGGSPLLLQALAADWSTRQAAAGPTAPAAGTPAEPPEDGSAVRFAVQYIHDLLTDDVLRTARALAVLGDAATTERVERLLHMLDMSASEAVRARGVLEAAGLTDGTRYRLAASRLVVLDRTPAEERELLHRTAAQALRESNADLTEVAGHLVQTRPLHEDWAVIALRGAGAQALHDQDAERAITFLRAAYAACADGPLRATVMAELAQAEWEVDPGAVRWYLTDLLDGHRAGRLSRKHSVLLVVYLLWSGRPQEADEILAGLDAAPGECTDELQARLNALHVWFAYFYPTFGTRYHHGPPVSGPDPGQSVVSVDPHRDGALILTSLLTNGPTEGARDAAERLLQALIPHNPPVAPAMAALIALIRAARLERAAEWCEALVADHTRRTPTAQAILLASSAILESWLGNFTTARERAEQALGLLPAAAWGVAIGLPLSAKVLACTALGDAEASAECFRIPVPQLMFQTLPGLHYLQARGRHHLSEGRYRAALGDFYACRDLMVAWKLNVSVFTAWRVYAAEAQIALGDLAEADRLLNEELGQPDAGSPWLREQARLLHERLRSARARAGSDEAAPGADVPVRLSKAEHRVARLVCEGLTNREIAARLCVTPSTVEQHLTRVYRKLGVRGRAAVPVALSRFESRRG
uniref:LuxR family transcriptional regulator n=1 Tax=Streptomyces sp. MG11 TaxID=1460674 RepID=A0A0M7BEY6_9ACTN|nr:LuxR family transcriptional regulator [Streptomyces sp. MG11]